MKKIVALVLFICLTFNTISAFASGVNAKNPTMNDYIVYREVPNKESGLSVGGRIPLITSLPDTSLQKELNAEIEKIINSKIETAKKDGALSIFFSYQTRDYENYKSIMLESTTTTGSSKNEINTFVFDSSTYKMSSIPDILGPNGVAIANKVVTSEIKNNPENYNTDFKGISETQSFYVEKGKVVIAFDKYQIAPGQHGIVRIPIVIGDVTDFLVSKTGKDNSYMVKRNYSLKMIPLRSVCEGLGFNVKWDGRTKTAAITKGSLFTKITVGENAYSIGTGPSYELELPPEISGEVTYVPISFFDVILNTFYSVDKNEVITFSDYQ